MVESFSHFYWLAVYNLGEQMCLDNTFKEAVSKSLKSAVDPREREEWQSQMRLGHSYCMGEKWFCNTETPSDW